MLRHYFAQRCRGGRCHGGDNPLRIGTIAIGSIYYVQPDHWWRERFRGKAECREPWMVEAFFNGTIEAARRDPETREWRSIYITGRSDFALIRSLRTGRALRIAVRSLHLHDDEGLSHSVQNYPTLPPPCLVERYFRRRHGFIPAARKDAALSQPARSKAGKKSARPPSKAQGLDDVNPIRAALKNASTIGEFERLAGIDSDDISAREAFWEPFVHLPGTTALTAASQELRRRIEDLALQYEAARPARLRPGTVQPNAAQAADAQAAPSQAAPCRAAPSQTAPWQTAQLQAAP